MTSRPDTHLDESLAFSTLGCPAATLAEAAEIAVRFGIGNLELRCLRGEPLEPDCFDALLGDPSNARALLDDCGVKVCSVDTSVRLLSPDAGTLATLEAFGRLADALGAPWLRVFDGGRTGVMPSAEEWAEAEKVAIQWADLREEQGISCNLMVETHWALTSSAVAQQSASRLPGLGLLWDTHHTWKAGGPLEEFWSANRERIVHLHVKDSRIDPTAQAGWRYVLPGEGEFPWAALRTLLTRDGFAGCTSFEWERHWHPTLPPLEDALKNFRRTLTP